MVCVNLNSSPTSYGKVLNDYITNYDSFHLPAQAKMRPCWPYLGASQAAKDGC